MNIERQKEQKRKIKVIIALAFLILLMAFVSLCVGSSNMSLNDLLQALVKKGSLSNIKIIWNIRIPRILAAIVAGAGLSLSGLMMQTNLDNPMASPATLGVSNAAVFGANLSIIVFANGFILTAFRTSLFAFIFALLCTLILSFCNLKFDNPGAIILTGVAMGSAWTALTTILQFYADDVGLSAAVIWSFGDLGRATYLSDLVMLIIVLAATIFFIQNAWRFNAMLSGDQIATTMGVNIKKLRIASLIIASAITAVIVSFLGMIGFVGVICPHLAKRFIGHDHRFTIIASCLIGSLLILSADCVSRLIGQGAALPIGAITSLLGAPFFLALLFSKEVRVHA